MKKKKKNLNDTPIKYLNSLGVPLKNKHFCLVYCEPEKTYDMILEKEVYEVDVVFLDMLALLHLIGLNCPNFILRIGAGLKEAKENKVEIIGAEKPKLILD